MSTTAKTRERLELAAGVPVAVLGGAIALLAVAGVVALAFALLDLALRSSALLGVAAAGVAWAAWRRWRGRARPDAVPDFWVPSNRQGPQTAPDDASVLPPMAFEEEPPAYPTGPDYTEPVWDSSEGLYAMVQTLSTGEERHLWSRTLGDLWFGDPAEARANE